MTEKQIPIAITAADAEPRKRPSGYPEPYASKMKGREKRPLGDIFGLKNFGVNFTRLFPGSISALRHTHSKQDEFVYILEGHPILITDEGETRLSPGMCAGFRHGTGNGHQLANRTGSDVVYLEIGDRTADDTATYPDDDIQAALIDGRWSFSRKDGSAF